MATLCNAPLIPKTTKLMWLQISCHKFNGVQEIESMHAYMSINLARLDEGRGIATTSLCHN